MRPIAKQNADERRNVEGELDRLERQRRDHERQEQDARRRLTQTQEALANGLAHAKLVEGRAKELELALAHAEEQAQKLEDNRRAAAEALEGVQAEEAAARARVAGAMKERDAARSQVDAAHRQVATLESRISALEEVERTSAAAGPARGWLVKHAELSGQVLDPLSHAVRAQEGFEGLVEALLGADVAALMVQRADQAGQLARTLLESGQAGEVVLLPRARHAGGRFRPRCCCSLRWVCAGGCAYLWAGRRARRRGAARRRGGVREP